ncbi:tRNA 2-thiouridine(34) synthase MnmA [Pyramidobacter piscolens]|uniref:tRNA 2-thiouridine(34) synthase MnmA n=1 Tax=Pyramidobacter piscolens TaxID=638849 RepID=UPI001FCC7AB2|nr:tRNA 2-thiouridine(34) synthase MnmA [Pyramidobacter piscolens]BDF78815.1 tRNA-specific 2-thiouridylase MnmA [Pyramidobacter piscolens]
MSEKILVGVSGGVDSALSALRLRDLGYDVTAAHLILKDGEDPTDRLRLERLARHVPVHELDCRARFCERVVRPFLDAYRKGLTPNPCVICNAALKFRALFELADRLGIDKVATGHYARVLKRGRRWAIARTDSPKDQTYMLCRLPHEWLSWLCFPLSEERSKTGVKNELASRLGAERLAQGDSQGICFLEGGSLERFLEDHLAAEERHIGRMVGHDGEDLGPHKGLIFYTEGQRRGLGLSRGPWFVARRDFASNRLLLSHGTEATVGTIYFENARWQQEVRAGQDCLVQYCYRARPVPGRLADCHDGGGTVELQEPAGSVSIGQALVLYDVAERVLLGGGFIKYME